VVQSKGAAALRSYGFVPVATWAGLGPAPTSTSTIHHSPFAIRHSPSFSARRSPLAARHLSPFAIRNSPFAIRDSPFAVFLRSLLAARCSPSFTIRYSPFAIRRFFPFAIRHSPFAVFSQVCETAVGAVGKLSLGWRLAFAAQCMNPHGHP
jgi:hypothetical protein